MNAELKPLLQEAYDLLVLGEDAVAKKWASVAADGIKAVEDAPAVVTNWPQLLPDLQALASNGAADADILAFVGSLAGGQGAAVAGLVSALAQTILLGVQQYGAIKAAVAALKAPSTTAAPASS